MFKTMLMGMMILALTSIAAAQSSDYKPLEFFAGYSHNQIDTGIRNDDPGRGDIFGKSESFHGLETSVTGNVSRYVGLKFDFSAHFRKLHQVSFFYYSSMKDGGAQVVGSFHTFINRLPSR